MTGQGQEEPRNQSEEASGVQYTDEDFLSALADHQPCGTKTIAEVVDCAQKTAYRRLTSLEDCGKVTSTKIGRELAWSLAE